MCRLRRRIDIRKKKTAEKDTILKSIYLGTFDAAYFPLKDTGRKFADISLKLLAICAVKYLLKDQFEQKTKIQSLYTHPHADGKSGEVL